MSFWKLSCLSLSVLCVLGCHHAITVFLQYHRVSEFGFSLALTYYPCWTPAEFGLACHLGVLSGLPCVGVAKNLLQVQGVYKSEEHQSQVIYLNSGVFNFHILFLFSLRSVPRSFVTAKVELAQCKQDCRVKCENDDEKLTRYVTFCALCLSCRLIIQVKLSTCNHFSLLFIGF